MKPDKVVRITLNNSGLPVPDQDPVSVHKDNQKVRWCADFDFQIEVEGYDDLNYGTGGGSDCSFRCSTGTFPEVRNYKYSITANGRTNDPDLEVKP
ncbi:MAG TPA: hypothetical protein VFO89_08855 [Thermoanaerobaculia bacterium]|nr:hypothetical protein [Thermoanaerobaculia bacterium]